MKSSKISIGGKYTPTFFFMEIETEESLEDIELMSEESQATFTHEYIHFLQDLFTIYGLANIIHIVDLARERSLVIHSDLKNKTFTIPCNLIEGSIASINSKLFHLYKGTINIGRDNGDVFDIEIEMLKIEKVDEEKKKIILKLQDINFGDEYTFEFGSYCILESMAYIIEKELFPTIPEQEFFPYKIVEALSHHIFEQKIPSEALVAICEISLDSFHPGEKFVSFSKKMKEENIIPEKMEDVFKFSKSYKILFQNKEYTSEELFLELLDGSKKSLINYYTSDYFNPMKEWLLALFEKIEEHKTGRKFSFAKLIRLKESKTESIYKLFTELGMPLMSNSNHMYWSTANEQAISLNAIHEVFKVLSFGHTFCGMRDYCSTFSENTVDDLCSSAPWGKVKQDKLCPFAAIWKMWKLDEKEVIFSS